MIAALVILGVLVLVAIWVAVFVLALPLPIAAAATVGLLLLALLVAALRMLRDRRRGAALEREMMRQAAVQAEGARPERRAEILALQRQMATAIADLKGSRLGGGGSAALYALPWYAVVGPPAVGKTTALAHSGLSFRTPAGSRRKIRGVAGTRNCDWWFAEEAILLDTAGRLSTNEDDGPEWRAFLDLLTRHRPRRPLDGIVVAVSVSDLLGCDEARVESLARVLRTRLDEITSSLELIVPVYVLVTKADLIPGFADFFADLGQKEASQVWGATVDPEGDALRDPESLARGELERLRDVLHARALERLRSPMNVAQRSSVLLFPGAFRSLEGPLCHFLGELFRASEFEETPLLRGFYLSSGMQTATASDLAASPDPARAFAVPSPAEGGLSPRASRGYFLEDLFRRVVFPDRALGVHSRKRAGRSRRRQIGLAVAFAATACATVLPAALAYVENSRLLLQLERDVRQARFAARPSSAGVASLTPVHAAPTSPSGEAPLDALLERWENLEQHGRRWTLRYFWGAYVAPDLARVAEEQYLSQLREAGRGPLRAQLGQELQSTADLPELDPDAFAAGHDALRLYLGLSDPSRLDDAWALSTLQSTWSRAARRGVLRGAESAGRHARRYLDALRSHADWAWPRDEVLVTRARGRLRSEQVDELAYAQVLRVAEAAPPLTPADIFFGASAEFVTAKPDVRVRGAFTRLGWERVRSALDSEDERIVYEPWVLGYAEGAEAPWSASSLQRRYFQAYAREWENFFLSLEVTVPRTLPQAIRELSALGKVDGPYARLFRRLADNARLDLEPPDKAGLADAALEQVEQRANGLAGTAKEEPPRKRSPVEVRFARLLRFAFGDAEPLPDVVDLPPAPLSQYLDELRSLEVALRQIHDAHLEAGSFKQELQRTVANVERLIGGLSQTERFAVGRLLLNPLRGSQGAVRGAEAVTLNDRWRTEVHEIYTRMKSAYPFQPGARTEVPLADFAEFFRPKTGILWRFYEENLASRFSRSGTRFALLPTERRSGVLPAVAECLSQGQRITDAIFFGNASSPSIPFGVQMRAPGSGVSETVLGVGDQELSYRNGPVRMRALEWPGKGVGASVQVRGQLEGDPFRDQVQRHGDFALFRLLDAGGVAPVSPGAVDLEAAWSLLGGRAQVVVRLRPPTSRHPFRRGFFQRFRCPAAVLSASGGRQ